MNTINRFILLLVSGSIFATGNTNKNALSETEKAQLTQNLCGSGMRFTPNKGQIANQDGKPCPEILYKGDGGGAYIYLRKTGLSYVYTNMGEVMHEIDEQVEKLIKAGTLTQADEQKKKDELLQKEKIKIHRVDMDFEGANTNPQIENTDQLDGYNNYYYGHCPKGILNIKQYNKVSYKNIYNNIDIVYYGSKSTGLKYDLIVQPHADPNQIKLHWKDAESIELKELNASTRHSASLIIKTSINEFTETLPKVYQNINGKIVDVKAEYCLSLSPLGRVGEGHVTFKLGTYNPAFPLVIDPWVTYYGGNQGDFGQGIATDLNGNVVITGYTTGGTFPTGQNGVNVVWQGTFGGNRDAFVVKTSPTGSMLWATYYGGDKIDEGRGIATDLNGNVVITGQTQGGIFPTGKNGGNVVWQNIFGGNNDAFVLKFASTGAMLWATYYGGDQNDSGIGIATDLNGNVVITGVTQGGTYPTGQNGGNVVWQGIFGGSSADAFCLKFSPTGAMLWATYYGGNQWDEGLGIATDLNGNVVITGRTLGGTFLTGQNGGNVVWQGTFGGSSDSFVVKFAPTGAMLWATYLGGSDYDYGLSAQVDAITSDVYISGDTYSLNFPVSSCAWQKSLGGGISEDGFLAHFKPDGSLVCSSYVGGPAAPNDEECRIALFGCYVYMTGYTAGSYPVSSGAWQTAFAGGSADAFVAQLYKTSCGYNKTAVLTATASPNAVCNSTPINFASNFSVSCDSDSVSYTWSIPGGTPAVSTSQNPTGIIYATAGNYAVQLKAKTPCDSSEKSINITINPCTVCNLTGQFTKGTANCTSCGCKEWIMINATGGTSPYSYAWPDGYDKRYKNQLCPGAYSINIKDKNGCNINVNLSAP